MDSYQPLHFRPATEDDFPGCLAIDHSYETNRVWQLAVTERADAKRMTFQMVKLPQPKRVSYPYEGEALVQRWCASEWFYVGEENGRLQAYLTAATEKLTPTAWIFDMAVAPRHRRQGHGSHLLALALAWAKQQGAQQLMVTIATKNNPAMTFFSRSGFHFCGYNEASYRTKEISLYYSMKI